MAKYAVDTNLFPVQSYRERSELQAGRTSGGNIPGGNIPGWNVPGGSIPRTIIIALTWNKNIQASFSTIHSGHSIE